MVYIYFFAGATVWYFLIVAIYLIETHNRLLNISIKPKLFYPVLIALAAAIISFAIIIVGISRNSIYKMASNKASMAP
ncbi:MAG: hypothetical protein GXO88_12655 [Chlorobi bacterium]|nr:hypothetical protein [Chlorobiota bacterium]